VIVGGRRCPSSRRTSAVACTRSTSIRPRWPKPTEYARSIGAQAATSVPTQIENDDRQSGISTRSTGAPAEARASAEACTPASTAGSHAPSSSDSATIPTRRPPTSSCGAAT
jgi:hypothetical protein